MGIVDMVTGAVTAVSSVVSNVQNMKIEATLSLIEESTRYTWILLNGLMATKLTEAADRLGWGGGPASGIFDRVLKLYDLMDGMDRVEALIRDNLVPDLKAISAASSGPRISIVNNIDGNVIGNADFLDSLANALIGKLRLQGVTA